jgi:hypothetical protein
MRVGREAHVVRIMKTMVRLALPGVTGDAPLLLFLLDGAGGLLAMAVAMGSGRGAAGQAAARQSDVPK